MDRRAIESLFYSGVFTSGFAAVSAGVVLPAQSSAAVPLIACGAVGIIASLAGFGYLWRTAANRKGNVMSDKKIEPIIGTDIQNSGGGIGLDIQSVGTPEAPSLGGESIVHAQPGQSAIGTRIVQSGSGVGMRVVQSGPGVGFRSVVMSTKPDDK